MNKLRKYRFLSMLLVIALVFGMLPEHVQAARETGPYDRYQNGREPGGNLVDSWDSNGLNFELYDNGHAYYWSFYVNYDDPGCDYDVWPDDTMIVRKNTKEYLDSIREVTIGDYDDTGSGIYLTNPDWNHYDEVYKDGVFCVTGFDEAPLLEKATLYISADGIKDYNQYGSIYGSYEYLPAYAFAYCPKLKKVYLVPANYHKGDLTFLNQSAVGPSKPAINSKAFMGDTLDIVVPMLCGLTMEDPVVKQEYQNANVTWIYDMDYDNNNNLLAANGGSLQVRFQMDGTLIISGNGDMVDFPEMEDMPWNAAKDKVREVIIQNGVTGIGKNAFKMCTNLEKVTLADSVTKIGDSAFEGCVSLKEIQWSKSLQSIGNRAFHTIAASEITLPEGLISIGEKAFYNSDAMHTFSVPSTVKHIGGQALAFNGGYAIITIESTDFTVDEAIVSAFSKEDIAIKYPAHIWSESLKEAVAGEYYDNVRWEALPQEGKVSDTLTWSYANGTLTLKGYGDIPDYVRTAPAPWYDIRKEIHYVQLPDQLTGIGQNAFINCDLYLVDVPETVKSIGSGAFNGNYNLVYFFFNGRPEIKGDCFIHVDDCYLYYQADIGWDETNMLDYGGTRMYWEANGGKCGEHLSWAYRQGDKNILTISGYGDMDDYTNASTCPWGEYPIDEVILSDSITHIGNKAFQGKKLVKVNLPKELQSLGSNAFAQCEMLKEVTFNAKLQSIGSSAFNGCKALTKVVIPDSVREIGATAFSGCAALTEIRLPDSLEKIEMNTFFNCSSLRNVTIPEKVTSIGMLAFGNCAALEKVTLNSALESIGRSAFSSCVALEAIKIPEGVTSISSSAFSKDALLKIVYLESTLQSIESYAFSGCNLQLIYYTGSMEQWNELDIDDTSDGNAGLYKAEILSMRGSCGEDITWSLKAETGELRFSGTGSIEGITDSEVPVWCRWRERARRIVVEEGITSIGTGAFDSFSQVWYVSLPNSLQTIGNSAFRNCQMLSTLDIPSGVEEIGEAAFFGTIIPTFILPEKITEIKALTFGNNHKLRDITIGAGVKSIAANAFEDTPDIYNVRYLGSKQQWNEIVEEESSAGLHTRINNGWITLNCESLGFGSCGKGTSWTVTDQYDFDHDGNKDVCLLINGEGAVSDFKAAGPWVDEEIAFINVGEGITSIGANAFRGMGNIAVVALPKSLTKVGNDAFAGCTIKQGVYSGTVYEYLDIDMTAGNEALQRADIVFNWSTDVEARPVRFDMKGHGTQVVSQNITLGNRAAEPETPVEEGYIFCGWYTGSECTTKYDFNSPIVATITLYAKWEEAITVTDPQNVTVDSGKAATFSITPDSTDLTYQWKKSTDGGKTWANSSSDGAKTAKLTMTVKASYNNMLFKCIVTTKSGVKYETAAAKLTVRTPLAITAQPVNVTAASQDKAAFKVTATGDGLTYQWKKSTDGGTKWVNSSSDGAKTNVLSMTMKDSYNNLMFRCEITDKYGRTITTNAVKLTLDPNGPAPAITLQPVDKSVYAGTAVEFTIETNRDDLTYQWKKSIDGGKTWVNSSSEGSKTKTLKMKAALGYNGYRFRCEVTDKAGRKVTSSIAKLSVGSKDGGPAITSQPENATIVEGNAVSFHAAVVDADKMTYQWKKSTDGGKTWVNSSSEGAKTGTLKMTVKASYDGFLFKCVITDANGKSVETNTAKLTVSKPGTPLAITTQPADKSVANGADAVFTVAATGDGLTYQWKKSTDGGKTWVNSSSLGCKTNTLTITTKTSFNGLQFQCVITDKYGKKLTSNAAKLTVK